MRRILVIGDQGPVSEVEATSATWGPFVRTLASRGWSTAIQSSQIEGLVSVNMRGSSRQVFRPFGVPVSRRILVQWESPAVQPRLFHPRTIKRFGLVLPLSPLWPSASVDDWIRWPQGQNWVRARVEVTDWNSRQDAVSMVNRNVVSANRGSMYYLRRQVADLDAGKGIVLGGHGWPATWHGDAVDAAKAVIRQVRERDRPSMSVLRKTLAYRPTSALGSIDQKADFLSTFRFSLVIENSLDYVSEKLFDVIAAGCVPIYVGPPLQPFGLDENLVVRAHPSVEGIRKAIATLSNDDVERTLSARRSFLHEGLDPWLPANTMAALANRVCDFLED